MMAKHKAIIDWYDKQDHNRKYKAGDPYPKKGRAKKERLEELLGSDNAAKRPVIAEVEEDE